MDAQANRIGRFSAFGYFRTIDCNGESMRCRYAMELVSEGSSLEDPPEVVLVLSNPGGADHSEGNSLHRPVPVGPGRSIKSVVQMLDLLGVNRCRILNLSDMQEPDSTRFVRDFGTLPDGHSIFAEPRRYALKRLLSGSAVVIVAWGTSRKLAKAGRQAEALLMRAGGVVVGFRNAKGNPYHPSPRSSKAAHWPCRVASLCKPHLADKV